MAAESADTAVSGARRAPSAAGPIAFQARLTPVQEAPASGAANPARGDATPGNARLWAPREVPAAGIAAEASTDLVSPAQVAEPAVGDGGSLSGQKQRSSTEAGKAASGAFSDAGRKPAAAFATAPPASAPSATAAGGMATSVAVSAEDRADAAVPGSPETANPAAEAALPPETPRPWRAARDMQFAVGGGDQRVEVRVAERAGELHVAVRTPDQRLAGTLRDDLPALTARLESAGLRAETWHTGAASAGRERLLETSSRALSQDSQQAPGRDGRRQPGDPPPQRPRPSADSSHPERKRKDFQWLLTSLR